ncbi:hypothetical protein A9Q95_14705 [Rhodobacterales bacterium 59_46_T64]|nr:hypothetical protein A9Q95_14705 [Rhodobacterales bacterium 59_46_T64]
MYHPYAERLKASEAKQFFLDAIKPKMPDDRAMPNDGENTVLRGDLTHADLSLLTSNVQHTILLSL